MMTDTKHYKAIVLDIDGTLIDDYKVVPTFTASELKRVSNDHEVRIILVSSRMPKSIGLIANEIGASGMRAAYNGALVLDNDNDSVIYSGEIPSNTAEFVFDIARDAGLHIGIFCYDSWIVPQVDYWALREVRGSKVWPQIKPEEECRAYIADRAVTVHKLMIRGHGCEIDDVVNKLSNVQIEATYHRNNDTILEVTASNSSKEIAISYIADKTGIDLSEMIAFGDSYNDISMLSCVGYGIAMDNAPSEVKAVADEITLSNNEDGIGLMLRKLFVSDLPIF